MGPYVAQTAEINFPKTTAQLQKSIAFRYTHASYNFFFFKSITDPRKGPFIKSNLILLGINFKYQIMTA